MLSLVDKRGSSGYPSSLSPPGEGAPDRVGPYRLCVELAAGGMASVYLAQLELGSDRSHFVALKIMHEPLATQAGFVAMFEDEAEIASRVRHGNVCAVFDYGIADGRHYLALEYLVGESLLALNRRLQRVGVLDCERFAARVAAVLAAACEGLHAAHELEDEDGSLLEVVHRDITPSNLILTFDGVAKVMDFGVLSAARKRSRTRTGTIKGKLSYVAPEVLRGEKLDRRVDVWGVGVVLWELLTGARLFARDDEMRTLQAVCDAPIPRPSEMRPGIPREMDEVVMKALSRDRDERYPTALALARDLARLAASGDDVVTSADLAEWMNELFPGGRAAREQLMTLALRSVPPRVSERAAPRTSHPEDTETMIRLTSISSEPPALRKAMLPPRIPSPPPTARAETPPAGSTATTAPTASSWKERWPTILASALLGALLGAAGAGWAVDRSTTREPPASVAAEPEAPSHDQVRVWTTESASGPASARVVDVDSQDGLLLLVRVPREESAAEPEGDVARLATLAGPPAPRERPEPETRASADRSRAGGTPPLLQLGGTSTRSAVGIAYETGP